MNYNTSVHLWRGYAPGTVLRVIDGHVFEVLTATGAYNPSQAVGRFTDSAHADKVLSEAGFTAKGNDWTKQPADSYDEIFRLLEKLMERTQKLAKYTPPDVGDSIEINGSESASVAAAKLMAQAMDLLETASLEEENTNG